MDLLMSKWRLFSGCLAMLRRSKSLLVFPFLTAAALTMQLILLLAALALTLSLHGGIQPRTVGLTMDSLLIGMHQHWWMVLAALLPCYLACNFTIIFFNAALVAAGLGFLEGGRPTIGSGLRSAWSSKHSILLWSLLSGGVSTVLQVATNCLPGMTGRLVACISGLSWSFATFFVVPLLVFERSDVLTSVRRSAELMKRTWGDQLTVRAGFEGIFLVLALLCGLVTLALVAAGIGVYAQHPGGGMLLILIGTGWLTVSLLVLGLVTQCIELLFSAVLYSYAMTGMLPEELSPDLLPRPQPR
jgi:hypothetical protein